MAGLCAMPTWARIIVVCGKNRKLSAKLRNLRSAGSDRLTVYDWCDDFATLVKASNVVVSKAGASTIAECAAAKVPLILTKVIPGQEDGNVEWAQSIGDCAWAPTVPQMVEAVTRFIGEAPSSVAARSEYPRNRAAEEIAKVLGGLDVRPYPEVRAAG